MRYYQWTKDQRSRLFPLVPCCERWGSVGLGFAAAMKKTSPEKEPVTQINNIMQDHSSIGEQSCRLVLCALHLHVS